MNHGDLEQYLGQQYAEHLEQHGNAVPIYDELDDAQYVLMGSLNALGFLSKVNLARKQVAQG